MATLLMPLPAADFDPTESAVPWQVLTARGHRIVFATPDGRAGQADPRMVDGRGLGPWKPLLQADARARAAHAAMIDSDAFRRPLRHAEIDASRFDGLILPGGHAPGMRAYLESAELQRCVAAMFERRVPIGAICHGVVLASRSTRADGRSVLHGLRTTALTRTLELSGWALTALWLGRYYRTYPVTVQGEVSAALARPEDFIGGPPALRRDSPQHLERGFTVRDGHYLSARWPGDAYRFADEFGKMLG